jgi:hypothetical protein
LTGRLEILIGKPLDIPPVCNGRANEEMLHAASQKIADEMRRLESEP